MDEVTSNNLEPNNEQVNRPAQIAHVELSDESKLAVEAPVEASVEMPVEMQVAPTMANQTSKFLAIKIGVLSGAIFSITIAALLLFFYHQPETLEGNAIQCATPHASANESSNPAAQTQSVKICPNGQYFVNNGPDFENGCQDIHTFNLIPGNGQCNVIKQIYQSPDGYGLNDQTKKSLVDWYKNCSANQNAICGSNQIADASGQCQCKTSYKEEFKKSTQNQSDSALNFPKANQKICIFDCDQVVADIESMRPTAAGSPETNDQLQQLLTNAHANNCAVPEISDDQKICNQYQTDANSALKDGKFVDYYKSSKKFIEADCSQITAASGLRQDPGLNGEEPSGLLSESLTEQSDQQCQQILAKVNVINDALNQAQDPVQKTILRVERTKLEDSYYNNAECDEQK